MLESEKTFKRSNGSARENFQEKKWLESYRKDFPLENLSNNAQSHDKPENHFHFFLFISSGILLWVCHKRNECVLDME